MTATKKVQSQVEINGHIIGSEQVTVTNTASNLATLSATVPAGTTQLIIHVDALCYWHPTGTPSSSLGHAIQAGKFDNITGKFRISNFKIVTATGTTTARLIYVR